MSYYVSINGQSFGPADLEELRQWHLAGSFAPSDFAWDDATQTWMEAGRFPALADVFTAPSAPPVGFIDSDGVLQEVPASAESPKTMETACANHADDPAETICPRCQRSLCNRCMVVIDGLAICVDCESEQKGAAISGWLQKGLTWGAPVLVVIIMLSAYSVFSAAPAPQPEQPVVRTLELGAAPRLSPEELSPEERVIIERDLWELKAALTAWRQDSANAGVPLDSSWVQTLTSSGKLASPRTPPREDLVYRPSRGNDAVELWTSGTRGRAFLICRADTIVMVPRPQPTVDTAPASARSGH